MRVHWDGEKHLACGLRSELVLVDDVDAATTMVGCAGLVGDHAVVDSVHGDRCSGSLGGKKHLACGLSEDLASVSSASSISRLHVSCCRVVGT